MMSVRTENNVCICLFNNKPSASAPRPSPGLCP